MSEEIDPLAANYGGKASKGGIKARTNDMVKTICDIVSVMGL